MIIRSAVWRWLLTVCVPCAALAILGRQIYLNTHYGLSTWKGGGMGMFAAADELANRYAKVFLVHSDGSRDPLPQLTPEDQDLLSRALEYPARENFLRAARMIGSENWIPAFQRRPVLKVNGNGDPVSAEDKAFRVMVASPLRSESEDRNPSVEIQFWKLTYDPHTRRLHCSLAETLLFGSQELYGSRRMRNDS
ncbi:MAG TPA: hypothetical protein VEI58_02210 [Chthoniobacterales bacterium]|nr:hypothetical protein [Chthoniobacterales bacterium]